MLKLIDNHIKYSFDFCQQCGACRYVCPTNAIAYQRADNGLKTVIIDDDKCVRCQRCVRTCPANRNLYIHDYVENLKGKHYCFAYNDDDRIRHSSSSGGACKTIIIESLKCGLVDGVYSLKKLEYYPSAVGEFYTKDNIPSYDDLPNSVYHSIMACTEIKKVTKVHRMMIVGTSCQLYALEKALKGKYDELVKVCIFCKQQKHLGSTKFLSKVIGEQIDDGMKFTTQYRGDGWPGFVRINAKSIKWETAAILPFGRRLWCVPGCDICGDPFGMEIGADISLMDPWVIKEESSLGETLITVHSDKGRMLLHDIPHLVIEEKSYQEIIKALGEKDVWRKRETVPYFLGDNVSQLVKDAGDAELRQRAMLEKILNRIPRMPIFFYRLLNKLFPKKRDQLLKI